MARLSLDFETDWSVQTTRARFVELWAAVAEKWGALGVSQVRQDWPVATGTSLRGFTHTVEVRGRQVSLTVLNPVRYVPFVHKRGTRELQFEIATNLLIRDVLQGYAEEVAEAAALAIEVG